MKIKTKEIPPYFESKLRKSELRYRRLFETAQDGISNIGRCDGHDRGRKPVFGQYAWLYA